MFTKRSTPNRNGGKSKENLIKGLGDMEVNLAVHFPFIKSAETDLIPHYYHFLVQSDTKGMDLELDALQMDLEKLLSSVAIRNRIFQTEIKLLEKRGKLFERQSTSGKRKKQDEKLISQKETLQKISKTHYNFKPNKSSAHSAASSAGQVHENVADIRKLNIPKMTLPKNDTANRFWVTVNEYCRPVTSEDLNLIDQLIEEHKEEAELKIPELGRHYSYDWGETDLTFLDKTGASSNKKSDIKKAGPTEESAELLRKAESTMKMDTIPGPLTQRLVLALMEENVPSSNNRLHRKPSRSSTGLNDAMCIERRLRKELVDVGILEPNDLPEIESDSITEEMKRVHQELLAVSKQNTGILKRLKTDVSQELARQRLIRRLDEVDKEIINQYNAMISFKLKQEDTPPDVVSYAHKLIMKQEELCKEMESVTPAFMRFFPKE